MASDKDILKIFGELARDIFYPPIPWGADAKYECERHGASDLIYSSIAGGYIDPATGQLVEKVEREKS